MNKCLYINLYGCTCILFLSGASSEIVGSSIGCFCFGNTVIWKQSERRRKADWETFPNIDLNH